MSSMSRMSSWFKKKQALIKVSIETHSEPYNMSEGPTWNPKTILTLQSIAFFNRSSPTYSSNKRVNNSYNTITYKIK